MRPKRTIASSKKSVKTLQSGAKDTASQKSCGASIHAIRPELVNVDTNSDVKSDCATEIDMDSVTDTFNCMSFDNVQRQQSNADNSGDGCWIDDENDADESDVEDSDDVDRYKILFRLGSGSFGDVHKAYDTKDREYVAIKKIKGIQGINKKTQRELTILQHVHVHDPENKYAVKLKDHFSRENQLCMVFELLSDSLRAALGKARRFTMERTRLLGQQLCEALEFLAKPEVAVIHGDLKPENIVFHGPDCSRVKLVDFGISQFHRKETIYEGIQSRYYRAPEVTLRLPSGHAVDVWSLGCILVEMLTGQRLFHASDKTEQMRKIVAVLGPPSRHVLDRARNTATYFDVLPDGTYTLMKTKSKKRPSLVMMRKLDSILGVRKSGGHGQDGGQLVKFKDAVLRMLDYDPQTRVTASQALRHRFFAEYNTMH
ncbi:dual specificity tyrosine-phosphorylation-regulated kinase 1A-like [Littorina saxatilis]|uniref:dual specificity tyrosine-phosphorylation-regulated kinase 1A-like n=1 Tax=Littorina saxatilis TaxID=31220 RepID=UPI0038B58345